MPLVAMIYPRGPRVTDPTRPDLIAHVVGIAADLGVDIVKTVLAAPPERMAEVVESSPPIIVAGGGGSEESLTAFAVSAMANGCAGLAVGRRVFNSPSPKQAVQKLAAIIHGHGLASEPEPHPELAGAL